MCKRPSKLIFLYPLSAGWELSEATLLPNYSRDSPNRKLLADIVGQCRTANRACSSTGVGQRPKEARQRVLISTQ